MKSFLEIVDQLNQRVASFGRCPDSLEVIDLATSANSWFTPSEICRAVEAVRKEMFESQKLNDWLSHYPTLPCNNPRRVGIIMAGNIPLVGLFDLLCTIAAGHQAWIKPSSKDRVLIEYICRLIKEIEPSTPIYMYDETLPYDAIIATGGEEANRYFERTFGSTKRLCRSSRHSVAIITNNTSVCEMELLANDIYSYSGLGCRNVSTIFAPRGSKLELPQYATGENYKSNYIQTKALLTLTGVEFEDNGCSVAVRSHDRATSLSTLTIWEYDSLAEVEQWIEENDDKIQCIVCRDEIQHPRKVGFGEAQHPTLFDYADGVDTMKFLEFND